MSMFDVGHQRIIVTGVLSITCINYDIVRWHILASPGIRELTRVETSIQFGVVTPYGAIKVSINIGPGNGLLSDGTKPLPERMLTY